MIIATAGHVDHGKTSLVQALTGIDTDRLEEEKTRGLTIDLGFAYTDSNSGERLGFVDVPGHIRFISNMLAGVGAIDYALLVIAADDGPMPQTLEHLAILDLLNVQHGAVALTKIDRVDDARVNHVKARIKELLASTSLQSSAIYPVSAITGDGVSTLASALGTDAREIAERKLSGHFRLAIDRCFTVKGSGVVITGSVFSGSVSQGSTLYLQPANLPVRVRELHTQNQPATHAHAGDRCAVNIAGANVSKDIIHRGQWLTSNPEHCISNKFDVELLVLATESIPLRNGTPVHVHTAASDVTGRLATLESASISPGQRGLVQLTTNDPLVLCHNDRVIIRDQAAERTIGGGIVVDTESPRRGRAKPERLATLRGIAGKDSQSTLHFLINHNTRGIPAAYWQNSLNLKTDELHNVVQQNKVISVNDEWLISGEHYRNLSLHVLNHVTSLLQKERNSTGLTQSKLAETAGVSSPALFNHIVNFLVADNKLKQLGSQITLPGHKAELTEQDQAIWQRIKPILQQQSTKPPVLHDLANTIGVTPRNLEQVMIRCMQAGYLIRPVKNRFFVPEAIEQLHRELIETANPCAELTVRQYRDTTGIGRNLAIEILEYFDRQGITQRQGDIRKIIQRQ